MTRLRRLAVLLVLGLLATITVADEHPVAGLEGPDSILFVGNSFTFYNNAIYTHLRGLLIARDPASPEPPLLKSMTISGAVLADHEGGLLQMLDLRPWHTVVLQGHSLEAIEPEQTAGFRQALEKFIPLLREHGARPVLFMTWAYADRPEMTPQLKRAYTGLGDTLSIPVVPVGLAFTLALRDIPGMVLHVADGKHPTLAGTYLAAAVFYAALYGESPAALDYDAGLDPATARQLRETAWTSVRAYAERP